jgi:surfeit locus 1 family protein
MIRRLPIIPTIVVLAAIGVMVSLGIWQLGRMQEKEALIANYEAAQAHRDVTELSELHRAAELGYRKVTGNCNVEGQTRLVAGRDAAGQAGWAQVAICSMHSFEYAGYYAVTMGWSKEIAPVEWEGGNFSGTVVPTRKSGIEFPNFEGTYSTAEYFDFHIVADPPLAGLQANATPDPNDIPNNHLSYAVQWFFFALTAGVIYVLVLRRKLADDLADTGPSD